MLAVNPARKAFIQASYRERRCLEAEPISELFVYRPAATHKSHSPEPPKDRLPTESHRYSHTAFSWDHRQYD
jgi:hypothetical protein